jgi:hypothetical protein
MSKKQRFIIDYACERNECPFELCRSLTALKGDMGTSTSGNLSIIEALRVLLAQKECESKIKIFIEHL